MREFFSFAYIHMWRDNLFVAVAYFFLLCFLFARFSIRSLLCTDRYKESVSSFILKDLKWQSRNTMTHFMVLLAFSLHIYRFLVFFAARALVSFYFLTFLIFFPFFLAFSSLRASLRSDGADMCQRMRVCLCSSRRSNSQHVPTLYASYMKMLCTTAMINARYFIHSHDILSIE